MAIIVEDPRLRQLVDLQEPVVRLVGGARRSRRRSGLLPHGTSRIVADTPCIRELGVVGSSVFDHGMAAALAATADDELPIEPIVTVLLDVRGACR